MDVKLGRRLLTILALTLAATIGREALAADDKVYTLKYQHSYPPSLSFYNKTGTNFIKRVEAWSGGRIKFQVFEVGAVASVAGMLEAVDAGILDVSQSWGGFYVGNVPEADIETGLPLAWDEAYEVYDAYYNRGLKDVIAQAYESRYEVKHFPAMISMQYCISTSKEVNSLDDLKGLKLRAIGVYGEFAQALGASATVVPGAELYTALQLGTIDGLIYDAEAVVAQGLESFLKTSIVDPNLNAGAGHWLINRETWESLPADLQQVIEDAVQYGNSASALAYRASAEVNVGVMQSKGVKMLQLSDEERARADKVAFELWDKVGTRSELAGKAVAIVKEQMKDYGRIQ